MNFALAREIYGVTPWHVDAESLPSLLSIVENIRSKSLELPEEKYNSPSLYFLNDLKVVDRPYGSSWNPGQLDNNEKFKAVGIVFINGPITVSGGASTIGMEQVSQMMMKMASDERIVSFIVLGNSGGGSSAAVEIMTDAIKEIDQKKPVYGLIKKGGMACSAMYGIISACREIYAESEMSLVGSCGTMMQFNGRAANTQHEGVKHIRIYASRSTEKNKEIEEALNNDNYELILNDLLDPINERFLNLIESQRPQLKNSGFDTGKAIFTKDAVGTFIDGIMSISDLVQKIDTQFEIPTPEERGNSLINNHVMTVDQLKQDHPETYNKIFKAGAESEAGRVKAWMVHADADLEKVKTGIESGKEISSADTQELLVKSFSRQHVENMETESPKNIQTEESKGKSEDGDDELKKFNAQLDEALKTQ